MTLQTNKRPLVAITLVLGLLTLSGRGRAAGAAAGAAGAETLSYADLVHRLTDLQRLAVLPHEGEATAQWSSYDRASRYDEAADRFLNWHANNDGFTPQFIRAEGDRHVLAEMKGPGCIWRIWSANPKAGHVKIYLDGASEPVTDLPFSGYFDRSNPPFDHPALVYTAARGQNSYVPIPYQKSCRIVAEPGWGQYYHFTYSTFPDGTRLPTFSRRLSAEDAAALKAVGDVLQKSVDTPPRTDGEKTERKAITLAPGQSVRAFELSGAAAITALRAAMEYDNRADEIQALREVALRITWDGQPAPAVWSPLGDFFGTAMGANRYKSLMAGVTDEGFYSHWYMPFAEGAVVELVNDGPHERKVTLALTHAPLTRPIEQLGRFHAKWHRDVMPPASPDRWPDWTVLKTTGRGRFCGMMLHVWNPRAGHNWRFAREGGWWWGEGDEKFFVDGEKFPSTFGTGTEDYFGYAWCNPSLFAHAFHSQTLTQNNKGHQSLNRWQVADSIPFQKSFDGYLEKYYPNDFPTRYAAVAYWYLDPAGADPHGDASLAERTGYFDLTDATEGENLKVVELTGGGTAEPQTMMINLDSGESIWSGGSQLWWRGGKTGDRLKLAVPVASAGKYIVRVGMTKAADYATVRLHWDGQAPLAPIDFFDKNLGPVEILLGAHALKRGNHHLMLEITGANKEAKGTMAGIDYVKLEPVE